MYVKLSCKVLFCSNIVTILNSICGKVMFYTCLSVIQFTGRWVGGCGRNPPGRHPLGRHLPRQNPPPANTPRRPLHRTVRIILECILVELGNVLLSGGSRISQGGRSTTREEGYPLIICSNFPENCIQIKKIRLGRDSEVYLCRSATAPGDIQTITFLCIK